MKGEKVEKRHKRCACITASGRERGGWEVDGLSKKEKGLMDTDNSVMIAGGEYRVIGKIQ